MKNAFARAAHSELSSHAPSYEIGHVEVSRLGRVALAAALVGACTLLWAWSRIDLRETALLLDEVGADLDLARSENARLRLELETLRSARRAEALSTSLSLVPATDVVVVGEAK